MKLNWWIILLALPLPGFQDGRTNFSGKWELEAGNSVNLPPSFNSVKSYVADIVQKGDSLIVGATMTGNGQNVSFPVFRYMLDGSEIHRADSLRGSFRWVRGKYSKDGKNILLDSRVLMIRPDGARIEFHQKDEWKIIRKDRLEMSIRQEFAGSDSVRTEKRIFRKVR